MISSAKNIEEKFKNLKLEFGNVKQIVAIKEYNKFKEYQEVAKRFGDLFYCIDESGHCMFCGINQMNNID